MSEGAPVSNPSRACPACPERSRRERSRRDRQEAGQRGSHGTFSMPWAFGRWLLAVGFCLLRSNGTHE